MVEAHVCSGADVRAVKVSASPAQSPGGGRGRGQDKSPGSPGIDTIPDKYGEDARAFQHSGQLRLLVAHQRARARARNTGGIITHLNLNVFHFSQ